MLIKLNKYWNGMNNMILYHIRKNTINNSSCFLEFLKIYYIICKTHLKHNMIVNVLYVRCNGLMYIIID